MTIEAPKSNSDSLPAEQALQLESVVEFTPSEVDAIAVSDNAASENRPRQISLLAMQAKPTTRPRNSWMKTAGKYPEGSPLDKIFEEGSRQREDERREA